MSPAAAKSLALTAAFTAGGLNAAATIVRGDTPRLRIAFGSLALGVMLTATASFAPSVAAAMSVLVIITALLTAGADTLSTVSRNLFN